MTTSTPPAWHFLHECAVPVALSENTRSLPDSAILREWNNNDTCHICLGCIPAHTNSVMYNGKAYHMDCFQRLSEPEVSSSTTKKLEPVSSDQCPDCRCAPNMPHSPDCDGGRFAHASPTKLAVGAPNDNPDRAVSQTGNALDTGNIAWVCTSCGEARYGKLRGVTTWHWDRCGICGRTKAVTQPRDFGGAANLAHGDALVKVKCPVCLHEMETDEAISCDHCFNDIAVESFAVVNGPGGVFVYHLRCYDEAYWGADGDDVQVMDRAVNKRSISGNSETFSVTFKTYRGKEDPEWRDGTE